VIAPELAEHFRGKRVLITGGLGFIGSTIARELVESGAQITLVDSLTPEYGGNLANIAGIEERVRVNISDVRDEHSFRFLIRDQDVLFNLAGQTSHVDSMAEPYTDLDINARSQLSILEACRHHNPDARVVFASTRQIYGRPRYLPVDEQHPLQPVDVNGINKLAGEWYHLVYGEVYGIRTCILRMTNTYGPRMRVKDARQTFLGFWFRLLLEGRALQVWGGAQRRDFNYVDDAVRAFLLAAVREEAVGKVYNLGDAHVLTLEDLAEQLTSMAPGSYEVVSFPEERLRIDIGDYFGDFAKIQAELGWAPAVPLEEGLRRTVDYYRRHGSRYWP